MVRAHERSPSFANTVYIYLESANQKADPGVHCVHVTNFLLFWRFATLGSAIDLNPILSYPILSYPTLPYPTLSYPILSYPSMGMEWNGVWNGMEWKKPLTALCQDVTVLFPLSGC